MLLHNFSYVIKTLKKPLEMLSSKMCSRNNLHLSQWLLVASLHFALFQKTEASCHNNLLFMVNCVEYDRKHLREKPLPENNCAKQL